MLYGALAQSLPDVDFVTALWLDPAPNLLVHRGFTHSFAFVAIATALLSLLLTRMYEKEGIGFLRWLLLIGIAMIIHPLLDACNAYGTAWYLPINSQRVSFHCLFVVDPLFSMTLGVALVFILVARHAVQTRIIIAWAGIGLSASYLLLAIHNRSTVYQDIQVSLADNHTNYGRILITPTPLNSWLWFVAVEDSLGWRVAHRSSFNRKKKTHFTFFPKNHHLSAEVKDSTSFELLKRFSQGYYTLEKKGDTLVFNDLRFGQITGWHDPLAPFVFHYYLNFSDANRTVMQRGRFANWNEETIRSMFKSITNTSP